MFIAPIVAYIDAKGYLRCTLCHTQRECVGVTPVYSDNSALNAEPCDACGKPVSP